MKFALIYYTVLCTGVFSSLFFLRRHPTAAFGAAELQWAFDKTKLARVYPSAESASGWFAPYVLPFQRETSVHVLNTRGEHKTFRRRLKRGSVIESYFNRFVIHYEKVGERIEVTSFDEKEKWQKTSTAYPFFAGGGRLVAFYNGDHSAVQMFTLDSKSISPVVDTGEFITAVAANSKENAFVLSTVGGHILYFNSFKVLWKKNVCPDTDYKKILALDLSPDGKKCVFIRGAYPRPDTIAVLDMNDRRVIWERSTGIHRITLDDVFFDGPERIVYRAHDGVYGYDLKRRRDAWRIPSRFFGEDQRLSFSRGPAYAALVFQDIPSGQSDAYVLDADRQVSCVIRLAEAHVRPYFLEDTLFFEGPRYAAMFQIVPRDRLAQPPVREDDDEI